MATIFEYISNSGSQVVTMPTVHYPYEQMYFGFGDIVLMFGTLWFLYSAFTGFDMWSGAASTLVESYNEKHPKPKPEVHLHFNK